MNDSYLRVFSISGENALSLNNLTPGDCTHRLQICESIRLVAETMNARVIVFGSFATGLATKYSDIDIVFQFPSRVIEQREDQFQQNRKRTRKQQAIASLLGDIAGKLCSCQHGDNGTDVNRLRPPAILFLKM